MIQDLFHELMLPRREKTESGFVLAFCVFFFQRGDYTLSLQLCGSKIMVTQLASCFPQLSFFCAIINNNMNDSTST